MASPIAKDLFAKAIGESGSEFTGPDRSLLPLAQTEQRDAAWATRAFGSARLFYLRQLPADEILKAAMDRTRNPAPPFRPIIDGYFLPDSLPHIYAAGKQAHIPLLGGWVANEDRPDTVPTADSFTVQAHTEFGPDALKFLTVYPATTDAEAVRSAYDYASDHSMGFVTWAWLEAHAQSGAAPVYRYFFDLPSPGDRNHPANQGAFHSDDIEYVFGALDPRPEMPIRPEDRALSELMGQYWTNFAKAGDPNAPGLPKWPAYTAADNYEVMHLDAAPAAKPDTLRPRYLFLNSVWGSAATK
jgi:para-nitrobenzyl esterase